MVGRPGKFQPRFTSGELDTLIQQNTDLHIYGTGASRMANAMPLPQGGFRARWGTKKRGRLNPPAAALAYNAGTWTVTAPMGGSATGPLQTPPLPLTTTAAFAVGANVLWRLDLTDPATRHVSIIDVIGFFVDDAALNATLALQYSNDAVNWTPIDIAHAVTGDVKSRRFMTPQGPVDGMRYWRLVLTVTAPALADAHVTISDLDIWSQPYGANAGQVSSAVRVKPFNYTVAESYDVVFTDLAATIYQNGVQVGAVATPYAGPVIGELNVKQKVDTMLVFHDQFPPLRIMHQGSPTEWNWDAAPYTNVPNVDYGGSYGNGVAAAWDLQFFGFEQSSTAYPLPSGGAHFQLTVNNEQTGNILYPNPPDYPTLATNIQTAIQALDNVEPGITVSNVSLPNTAIMRVAFTGAGNQGDAWAISGKQVDKGDCAISATHSVIGQPGGEPIFSQTQGYPACGGFYAQRLLIGGFPNKPNYVVASVQDDFFNLNTTLQEGEAAMLLPLDTSGAEQVIDIHAGRNLTFFTTEAEYWLYDHSLDATVVPQVVLASRNGLARGVEPQENEAKTLYVHRNRGRIFEFGFSYPDQNYISTDISVQSSSLVNNAVDAALRKATSINDINTLFIVLGDGTGLAIQLLRGQDVTAFARNIFGTDQILAVDVNGQFDVNFCTQRQVGGQAVQFLETADTTTFLDQNESRTLSPAGTLITGLTDLEGATVWAQADGYWQGPFTVVGGEITLNFAASNVTVGRWSAPDARTLPQPRDVAPKTVVRRPARVHTLRCTVVDTTSIAIGANGQPAFNVPLNRFGNPVDQPMAPFTGEVVVEGILGFSKDAIAQITQVKPGALTVTGITVEVDL